MIKKLIALLLPLVLSGCAALPTKLDVQTGPELAPAVAQEFSYYTPSGPAQNASPQEIVSGFLAAGTGPQNDYAVARQFLSQEFAQRWNPENQTIIRTGAPSYRQSGDSLVVVDLNVGARIDDQGRYQDSSAPDPTNLRFRLVEVDGQWRISSAPNLTVVTPPVFSVVFNAFPIYFVDRGLENLVPDLRWFPSKTSTATRLVNALLAGPSSWLEAGVTSAIPEGTQLTINAVIIVDGVAQVDFDADALSAGALERRVMLSQLRSTLLQVLGVDDVSLSVNGSVQEISDIGIEPTVGMNPTYLLTANGVERLGAVQSSPMSGTNNLFEDYRPLLISLTDDGDRIAFTNADGVFEIRVQPLQSEITQLSELVDVAALEYDKFGSLWAFPRNAAEPIEVYDPSTVVRKLESSFSGTRTAATIAPEGTRFVQSISEVEADSVISIGTVLRDANRIPLSVNPGLLIYPVLGDPIAVAWQGNTTLRVLETTASGLTAFSEYPVAGPRTQLTMPPAIGLEIHSAVSTASTYLLSDAGEVWLFTANNWRRILTGVVSMSALR